MFYANVELTNLELPQNRGENNAYEVYKDGRLTHSYTSERLVEEAKRLFSEHFADTEAVIPVSMPVDLASPLGFACFLGNNLNGRKVFVPSNYNMTKILRSLAAQKSSHLVCDGDFFSQKP